MLKSSCGEILSDEFALEFMFAVHASIDEDEGVLEVPQPRRHHLIERAINQIVAQFETGLAMPLVRGKFHGPGAIVIYLDKPDFGAHAKLYDPNSFGVLDIHYEENPDGGERVFAGFDAYVRLGESNTWLCVGIKPPEPEDDDNYDDDFESEDPLGPTVDAVTIERVAAIVARSTGFGELKNKRQRRDFARPIAHHEISEDIGDFYVRDIAELAESFNELGIIPMKAKELKAEGKTIAEIAKLMNITKQKAERAADAEIPKYIIDNLRAAEAEWRDGVK